LEWSKGKKLTRGGGKIEEINRKRKEGKFREKSLQRLEGPGETISPSNQKFSLRDLEKSGRRDSDDERQGIVPT